MKTRHLLAVLCAAVFAVGCQKETLDEPQPVTAASTSQFSGTAYLWMGFSYIPFTVYFDQDYSPGYHDTTPKALSVSGPQTSYDLPYGVELPFEVAGGSEFGGWDVNPNNAIPFTVQGRGCSAEILSCNYTTPREEWPGQWPLYPGLRYYGTIRVWNITREYPNVWFDTADTTIGRPGICLIW